MKELIIGLDDNTKELANIIRKENNLIDYINYNNSKRFKLDLKYLFGLAFIVVDYNNPNEVSSANYLAKLLNSMYSICVITIACNTKSIKDELYYNSSAITYIEKVNNLIDEAIISIINNIDIIFDDTNDIRVGIDDIYYINKNNHEFKVITSSSKDCFANIEEEIKNHKNYILYVEANSLFEIYDIDSTLNLLHLNYKEDVEIIFCSKKTNESENINIKILAF